MGLFDLFNGRSARRHFARQVMARMAHKGWAGPLTYDPESFSIAMGQGRVALGDLYARRSNAGRALRAAAIDDLAEQGMIAARGPLPPLASVADRLTPVIRKRVHVGDFWLVALRFLREVHHHSLTPLSDSLCAMVVIDDGKQRRTLDDHDLAQWGVGFDELMSRAMQNLRTRAPPQVEREAQGVHVLRSGDDFAASRLLLPDLMTDLPLAGDPVVLAADAASLRIAGSGDRRALDALGAPLAAAIDAAEAQIELRDLVALAARPNDALALTSIEMRQIYGSRKRFAAVIASLEGFLSAEPLAWRDGEWRPFTCDPTSPLARLAVRGKVMDQTWQGGMIWNRLQKNGTPAGAPSIVLCSWEGRALTAGMIDLSRPWVAPIADLYRVYPPHEGAAPLVRTREALEAVLGPFGGLADCWPPRLVVDRRVTRDQWARLQAMPEPDGADAIRRG